MTPIQGGIVVEFRVHGAEGTRTYAYYGADAIAIQGGADPAQFSGERDGGARASVSSFGEVAGEIATDIAEIL